VLRVLLHFLCSEGGFFNCILEFPNEYPDLPPVMRFVTPIWHPNGMFSWPCHLFASNCAARYDSLRRR
jgi:hypothetical protein